MAPFTKQFLIASLYLTYCSHVIASPLTVVELEPFFARSRDAAAPAQVVISGEQWRANATVALAELLQDTEPALALVRKGAMSNDVVLRGLGGDDISVTLDGRKIYCACANRMDPPLSHATLENTERIEIAAGPFSLKRSGTLGGHINLVSAQIAPGWQGHNEVRYGSFDAMTTSNWISYADSTFAIRLQGAWQTSDPYKNGDGIIMTDFPTGTAAYLPENRHQRAYTAWHAGAECSYAIQDNLRIKANYARREDEEVLFPGLKMDADKTKTDQIGLRIEGEPDNQLIRLWTIDAYYHETDHVMSDRLRVSSASGPGATRGWFMQTDANATTMGMTLDVETIETMSGAWRIGTEWGHRIWDSSNIIGNNFNAMLPDAKLETVGLYLENKYTFTDTVSLEAGLRLDHFAASARADTSLLKSIQGSAPNRTFNEPAGFLSLRYSLDETKDLFIGIGSVARAPNPQELYIQVDRPMANPDWLGNPELDAPRSTELTTGFEFAGEKASFRVRVFHAWLDDYIYPVRETTPSSFQSYANIDATLYGVETKATYHCNDQWTLNTALAWQQGEKHSRFDTATNDVLAEIPPLRAQTAIQYHNKALSASVEANFSAEQGRVDTDLNEQDLGAWWTLSLHLRYQLNTSWTLGLACENLFDTTYAVHNAQVRNPFSALTVVDEPGRQIKTSLSFTF